MLFPIINIIIATILFYRILKKDVLSDFTKWDNNISIKHKKEWAIRAFHLIPTLLFLILPVYTLSLNTLYKFLSACSLVAFTYLILFNGWFNTKRNYPYWSTGSDDEDDAITDNILQSLPKWSRIPLQILLVAVSLFFYIKFQLHECLL